jgi:poly(3-hydroxybutyrate) depolymerase
MGATYNDLYAAIGVHSGLACGAAIDLPSALVAMRQGGGSDERVVLERFPAKWIPVRVKKTRQNKKLELRSDSIGTEKALSDRLPVPTIVFHGDRDTTVHPNNGDQVLEQSINTASTQKKVHRGRVPGGHAYTRTIHTDASGRRIFEHWSIHGAGHAWSGGSPAGSYTDPQGPNATKEMLRFFLEHSVL